MSCLLSSLTIFRLSILGIPPRRPFLNSALSVLSSPLICLFSMDLVFVVHALEEGMSPQIVMTFTGHEDYDSLKPYIAITDKTRKNLMTAMFSK